MQGSKDSRMTIAGHLAELRARIIRIILALILGFAGCYVYRNAIFSVLLVHAKNLQLIVVKPAELFMESLKTSFFAGFILVSPVVLYQVCSFLWPGLKDNERKFLLYGLLFGGALFVLGALFAYFVVIPAALHFFIGLSVEGVKPMYTLNNYMSFMWTFLTLFGLAFQVPIIMALLALLGLLKPETLKGKRKYCILVIFVISAIITPPDVVSQVLMALPLIVLYEIGIKSAELTTRRRRHD